ncbi:hypothetical protein N7532_011511 [Penicillium argentinense]|uniref:Tyrosine specific protein phosphatases domain-containing protein n=1 Tax=Penicillium argentinense TaxID=1131581 RepID=A0A9W9JUX1_9EURO|nr:uncharacterized protein N7532_011511 [Penicillium argentinense]KAJ5082468.1 hypothetical protein N7532_011511 [Penicillium argentinense]
MSGAPPTTGAQTQNWQDQYVRTQEYTSIPRHHGSGPGQGIGLSSALGYFLAANEEDNDKETVVVDAKVFNPSTHQFTEGDFICPGFFSLAQLDGFTRRFTHSQWKYDMRRELQFVFPFLALGPSSCLRDRDSLRAHGFTLLLGVRNTHSANARLVSGDKAAADLGIQVDTIDVLDNQELISAFPHAIRRINDHLAGVDLDRNGTQHTQINPSQKRKVLVFCESGNERSAGVIIAYVMAMLNVDTVHAARMVQQHRFCVSIEDPMKRILLAFESILAAKRDVEQAKRSHSQASAATLAPPPVPPVLLAKKRSFADRQYEEMEMDNGEMDVDDDVGSLLERKPIAPFQDRVA